MTAFQKHLGFLALMLSCAAAQNPSPASVRSVKTSHQGSDLRIEITVTAPVKPSVETAENPHRILLDFPNTVCTDSTKSVSVHANGVRQVRTAQHSTAPFVTRVVLDVDEIRPYVVTTEGTSIILTIAGEDKHVAHGAPVAATSGNLLAVFRRRRDGAGPVIDDTSNNPGPSLPPPPPLVAGPSFQPPSSASSIPAPPPAVAQPQVTTPAPASAVPATLNQVQIAVAPKPNASSGVVSSAPTAPAVAKAEEKRVEIAAASAPVQPVSVQPAPSRPPTASPQPAPVTKPAPTEPVTPKAEEKIAEVVPPPVATAAPETAPTTADTTSAPGEVTESANTSPSPVEPAAAAPTSTLIARSDDPSLRTVFRVKYVAEGVAYLEGGRTQGLTEGMKLLVEDSNHPAKQGESVNASDPRIVAELEVSAVADTSAVTDIHSPKRPVKVGDLAYLSTGDAESLVQQRTLSATRQYPVVVSFTEGDTLDEEARQEVPRPPLPSVNRARGRFGFDSIETFSHGANTVNSTDLGVVFRGDITRIAGTHWNLSGYWRGRLTKESAAAQKTLQQTLNRTYHLNMTYDNPNSALVAGFGRLYLPWAPSLDTIDGGYFGVHLSKGTILGVFGGSTPDPSSWDYSPDRIISGAFVNFDGGDYNGFHYSSTSGAGISMIKWAIDRPFLFLEDSVSYKRTIAVYESAQFDNPKGNSVTPSPGPGLGRNFFTLRVNPVSRLELDANYNYFRDVPTFDTTLIGTGLLDKFLFQGFSAGGRLEVLPQIWLSSTLGRSTRSGDSTSSINQMYGITFGRVPVLKLRADLHYSRFNSSFGDGHYESFSLSRQVNDRLRLEALIGQQNFGSTLTLANRSRFLTGTIETVLGPHYYLQSIFTTNRGDLSYDQFMFSIGYRFDNRRKRE
ncbi:MAG TPA: AMIN domain-containing protein [Candidatus Sulfotelmatobacter sp.]|nr:AMIN domain-containing protein [Candidatus Sulfotelmatobacter sp.]